MSISVVKPRAIVAGPRRLRRDRVRSALEIYIREINQTPLLSAAEEQMLARRIAQGDAEARDQLVRANLRLVVNIARRYSRRGVDLLDLVAEGNLGLLRAVEDFDPQRGYRFSTYATHWIRQAIGYALIRTGPTVRVPAYMVGLLAHWRRAAARLREELGRPPSPDEVAQRLDLPLPKVKDIANALRVTQRPTNPQERLDEHVLDRHLPDMRGQLPDETLIRDEDRQHVQALVAGMKDREAAVLRWRFGLDGQEPQTLGQIGQRLGVTRERVRQIEHRALENLRRRLVGADDYVPAQVV
jgi:RNA polymerase primary sigma factor